MARKLSHKAIKHLLYVRSLKHTVKMNLKILLNLLKPFTKTTNLILLSNRLNYATFLIKFLTLPYINAE